MYDDAVKLLTGSGKFYIDLSLDRVREALNKFSNPQDGLKCIHVAGTNGKGSVCTILDSILQEAGYKTGLYTSPHIWEYTERIKICGVEISKADFEKYVREVCACGVHLTEFEILTVVMFLYFKRNNVDIVILETGLGGRFDATNVIKTNLCSIITHIDLDHTERLGNTKSKIAFEKAGIIKDKSFVVVGDLDKKALEVIERQVQEKRAFLYKKGDYSLDFKRYHVEFKTENGDFHFEDYAIPKACLGPSLMAAFLLEQYFNFYFSAGTLQKALLSAALPCRMEKIQVGEKLVILDVAHNVPAALNLKDTLQTLYPEQNLVCVMGMLKDKDIEGVIHVVAPLFKKFYVGSLQGARGESYERIVQGLIHEQILKDAIKSYNKISEALDAALSDDNNIVIVFGSFHTASLARDELFQITSGR